MSGASNPINPAPKGLSWSPVAVDAYLKKHGTKREVIGAPDAHKKLTTFVDEAREAARSGNLSGVAQAATRVGELWQAHYADGSRLFREKTMIRELSKAVTEAAPSKKAAKKLVEMVDLGYNEGWHNPRHVIVVAGEARQDLEEFELAQDAAAIAHKRKASRLADEIEADEVAGDAPIFVDVAALGDEFEPPKPTAGSVRDDGIHLLYAGKLNVFGGEPGAFKTGSAALAAVETLKRGGRVLWADLDHNGAQATVTRLVAAGAPLDVLRDPDRFRLIVGEAPSQILAAVASAAEWLGADDLAVIDSAGELVSMFGGNSNDADDWTRVNRDTIAPLAATGAAVLLIDHFPKTASGTGYATGTSAKKRTIQGAFYALAPFKSEPPRPGAVGKVAFTLLKDNAGGTGYAIGECVAVLEIDSRDPGGGPWSWRYMPGRPRDERNEEQAEADVAYILSLPTIPTSRSTLRAALIASQGKAWGTDRMRLALDEARNRRATTFPLDPSETPSN